MSRRVLYLLDLWVRDEAQLPWSVVDPCEVECQLRRALRGSSLAKHLRIDRVRVFPSPTELDEEQMRLLSADPSTLSTEDRSSRAGAQLCKYIIEAAKAQTEIEMRRGIPVEPALVESALVERLGLESEPYLPEQELDAEKMVRLLDGYTFPEVLERLLTNECYLPEGLSRRLDEERRKFTGEIWEVHKKDDDPWPSNPHAHNVETAMKLNLSTGDLHDTRTKRADSFVRTMPKKKLLELRSRFRSPLPGLLV